MVTVITKTIGPNPPLPDPPIYDYGSFTDAEAAVPTIVGGTDLVAADTAVVFEAEAGTYNESVAFNGALVTDATRNVTYKAAAGSGHGGVAGQGVHLVYTGGGSTLSLHDAHTVVEGLSATNPNGFTLTFVLGCDGAIVRRCIVESTAALATASAVFYGPNGAGTTITIQDSVIKTSGTAYGIRGKFNCNMRIRNCTLQASLGVFVETLGRPSSIELLNNLSIGPSYSQTGAGVVTLTGSNNFGEDGGFPWPVAVAGTPATITASTAYDPGAGDFALYVASNGALLDSPNNDVIGQGLSFLDGAGDVPGYDIQGNPRGANISNPGAFEIPQGPTVVTKTIGSDKDYPSFTAAEADVVNIAVAAFGSADLVANNGAIVFEADAGTYTEDVTFSSSLTTDATRNVTYKPAAGSEHGGDSSAGVIIQGTYPVIVLNDNYTVFDGLTLQGSYGLWNYLGAGGTVCRNLTCEATGSYGILSLPDNSIPVAPITIENCVVISAIYAAIDLRAPAIAGTVDYKVTNCTLAGAPRAIRAGSSGIAGSVTNIDAVNNLSLVSGDVWVTAGSGTINASGSNNFGGSSFPFPPALRGTPYPITPTTDVDPGPGDWAIYDAATGALIDDPDNDVLGGGVGPDADADVPTTDIIGNIRSGDTTDPGAFQRPALDTIMRQIYQQDAPFAIGASPSGASGITHQLGPASADYFTINSTTSATITVPSTAHAMRIACVFAAKGCDVTLELDASNSVYLGSIGGVANIQSDLEYFWSFASVASDGTYPRVKIEHDGVFSGDQQVYLWWHLA